MEKNLYQSLEVSQPQMAVPESLALSVRLLQSSEAPFRNTSFAAGLLVATLATASSLLAKKFRKQQTQDKAANITLTGRLNFQGKYTKKKQRLFKNQT